MRPRKKLETAPTLTDLAELPRWALVGYAIFCARQASRLLVDKTKFEVATADALQAAEFCAVLPPQTDDLEMLVGFEVAMEVTRSHAEVSYKKRGRPTGKHDAETLEIARRTLNLCMFAEKPAKIEKLRQMTGEIADSVLQVLSKFGERGVEKRFRAMFKKLEASARKEQWDDETKIPQTFF